MEWGITINNTGSAWSHEKPYTAGIYLCISRKSSFAELQFAILATGAHRRTGRGGTATIPAQIGAISPLCS